MPDGSRERSPLATARVLDDFVTWHSGGTPPKENPAFWSGDIPWLTPKDMKAFDIEETSDYLTSRGVAAGSRIAPAIATYVVVRGMILAHTFPVSQLPVPSAFNQDIKAVVPCPDLLPRYLGYWLQGHADKFLRLVGESTHGTKKLDLADLRAFPMELPPLSEQAAVVEILEALDGQIRATEQIIAKLVSAQEGMIVDLLTKGIDENGALRDFTHNPAQFCDSSIGRVPVDWEVGPLSTYRHPQRSYLKTGPFGSSLKQEHWVDEGVPVVTIGSLGDGYFIETELLYISAATASALSSYALSPGDIVFSRVADVGRSVVIGAHEDNWIMSSNMMWIAVDPSRADPRFVRANIAINPHIRSQIRRYVNSAGRDVANAKIMNLLQFPWPPLQEQIAIADRIVASDAHIAAERSTRAKLRTFKDGLMADLLTGRVRVALEAAQ